MYGYKSRNEILLADYEIRSNVQICLEVVLMLFYMYIEGVEMLMFYNLNMRCI